MISFLIINKNKLLNEEQSLSQQSIWEITYLVIDTEIDFNELYKCQLYSINFPLNPICLYDCILCFASVVRKLYGSEEDERRCVWPTTSDSDTSQSDSNARSSPVPVPVPHRGGYCSDSSPCKVLPPIGVFWDIENCQVHHPFVERKE